jgi:hypothetical protein
MSAEDALFRVIAPAAQVLLERKLARGEEPQLSAVAEEALKQFEESISFNSLKEPLLHRLIDMLEARRKRAV